MARTRDQAVRRISLAALGGSDHETVHRNPNQTAYRRLKEDIVLGRLPFGAILSSRKLGREMGTSFLPIADALRVLEVEGLVETRDRVGTRVKIPTVEDIQGVYTVREALESQAARLCAERATKEQRRLLKRKAREVDGMYRACEREGASEDLWLDTTMVHSNFHHFITECAGCPMLTRAVENSQVLMFKILFDSALRRKKRPENWHSTLAAAIVDGSPSEADAAARQHTVFGIDEVLSCAETVNAENRWRVRS